MGLELNKATQASLNAVKGELIELARHQVRDLVYQKNTIRDPEL